MIAYSEHISPEVTGDNISAKKVALYGWNGTDWTRASNSLVAGKDYDYIDVQQTSTVVDTFVFKTGGSGGTTVQTITVTYVDATKADLNSVEYS
jgi:hypothetical protein